MPRSLAIPALLLLLLPLAGCPGGDDDDSAADVEHYPTVFCPGDPSGMCAPGGDQTLYAGAAQRSLTPTCWETWNDVNDNEEYGVSQGDTFDDCGCDRLCDGDDGYPGPDEGEGDGVFQAIWLAGSSHGRAMNEIHDDLWARAVVLSQGETSLAVVSIDVVGYNRGRVESILQTVRGTTDVDYVLISSTHTHQGPDTMGLWGSGLTTTGIVDSYFPRVEEAIVAAIEEAAGSQVPVDVRVGEYDVQDAEFDGKGIGNFINDHRDPVVIDNRIFAVQLIEEGSGTLATLVNWPNHPETMIDEIIQTSGFAHDLRLGLENGVETADGPVAGLGGMGMYVQGMCGGMMTPLGVDPTDLMGVEWTEYDFGMVKAIGDNVAWCALQALQDGEELDDPALSFRFREVAVPVENEGYWMFLNAGVIDRDNFVFEIPDPDEMIDEDNMPTARTEVGVIELGPIQILTFPGEMLPDGVLGGYDGSLTGPLQELVHPDNPNPPPMDLAPEPPYLVDEMTGSYRLVFGLSNDELGYLIPDFQYELGPVPYLTEPDGDHYEETNSLGPSAFGILEDTARTLLAWEFPG